MPWKQNIFDNKHFGNASAISLNIGTTFFICSVMIEPTDIRLGNLLMESGQLCQVESISAHAITVRYPCDERTETLVPEQLIAVDLTEDLLGRCGFLRSGTKDTYRLALDPGIEITVNPHIAGGISVQLCVHDHWCGKPVNNVHHLQNIYRELTDEELMIEPSAI